MPSSPMNHIRPLISINLRLAETHGEWTYTQRWHSSSSGNSSKSHLVISRWTRLGADALDQARAPGLRPRVQGQASVVPVADLHVGVGAVRHQLVVQYLVPGDNLLMLKFEEETESRVENVSLSLLQIGLDLRIFSN